MTAPDPKLGLGLWSAAAVGRYNRSSFTYYYNIMYIIILSRRDNNDDDIIGLLQKLIKRHNNVTGLISYFIIIYIYKNCEHFFLTVNIYYIHTHV